MGAAERTELAHELGYTRIGKDLPDNVTLSQIIKSMPPEVSFCLGVWVCRSACVLSACFLRHKPSSPCRV